MEIESLLAACQEAQDNVVKLLGSFHRQDVALPGELNFPGVRDLFSQQITHDVKIGQVELADQNQEDF